MSDGGSSFGAGARAVSASSPRASPAGWLAASACAGAAAALFALNATWRPFPGLPAPPGDLGVHLAAWARGAVSLPFPRMFEHERAGYALAWRSLPDAGRLAIEWRAGLAGWAGLLPGALMWRAFMSPSDAPAHLRGSRRWERPAAAKRLNARLAKESKSFPDHEIAPGVPYPSTQWTRQVLCVGGTGSGKSTFLKPLIHKIVEAREPLLLFDPKGEFTAQWPGLAILAPWDARSLAWDIARDMRGIGDARKFAEALVLAGNDPMWSNAARQIIVGLLLRLKIDRGEDWGWAELASLLAAPLSDLNQIMAETHPEALRAVEKASVTTQGILINLASYCAPVFDLARAWGSHPRERRISFVAWAKGSSRHRQIALQGSQSYSDLAKCYVRGVFEAVSAVVASAEGEDDDGRKLWIVADEFPEMGPVPIRSLYSMGRSRGIRCVLACQDFAQLEEIHGEKLTRSMASMCGAIVVAQIQQGDTADAVAKMLGTREIERVSRSTSSQGGSSGTTTTIAHVREESAVYKPSELGSRLGATADRKGVVCALIHGGEAYELFWPMHPRRKLRPQQVLAKWTTGAIPFVPRAAVDILSVSMKPAAAVPEAKQGFTLGGSSDEGIDALDHMEAAPSLANSGSDDAAGPGSGPPAMDELLIEQLLRGAGCDPADASGSQP